MRQRWALISVSDKTDLVPFVKALATCGFRVMSTGGTAKALRDSGLDVTDVSQVTEFPEIMDGRIKTLHPRIHGGLLAKRDDPTHIDAMWRHGIPSIDMLVVNLYPFEKTVAKGAPPDECIENIDIGGPAMIRAAAKNHQHVAVVTQPSQYPQVLEALDQNKGDIPAAMKRSLAHQAFAHTAAYDSAIATWFTDPAPATMPSFLTLAAPLKQPLRYGENPHQEAAFYVDTSPRPGIATATKVQGKELSYNNLNDTDAAFELVAEFSRPTAAIIKHANPCGVAEGTNLADAFQRALRCDPVSAYGGIIAVNRPLDAGFVDALGKLFLEVIIAPAADPGALEVLSTRKNLRVLLTGSMPDPAQPGLHVKSVSGGYLVQHRDSGQLDPSAFKIVTKRAPSDRELYDMHFAMRVAKHVKSNAIVYAKDGATMGIGAGQMSRLDSTRIAALKAVEAAQSASLPDPLTKGSVVASDAFFPFADGLLAAAEAGATAIIQPGGSLRDEDVIAAADARDLAMVFTGMRFFRH